jgi:excinuclease Cho
MPRDASTTRKRAAPRRAVSKRRGPGGSRAYEYPELLRAMAEALPAEPGVYFFHGEDSAVPLYIGKSVNLRARVFSHLRNRAEARMLRQTRRISHIATAGEIGALLLEARLIKQQQPLMNQKLRRTVQLCSLHLRKGVPQVVYSKDVDFAAQADLFGLFTSRHAALEWLRDLADAQRLCFGALGLERVARGRACFRAMVGQCAGVCRGDESPADHDRRLRERLESLRVACWPYPGRIGLVERTGDRCQIHVVRNWCYLGSAADLAGALQLDTLAEGFDADGYRILCEPVLRARVEIIALPDTRGG